MPISNKCWERGGKGGGTCGGVAVISPTTAASAFFNGQGLPRFLPNFFPNGCKSIFRKDHSAVKSFTLDSFFGWPARFTVSSFIAANQLPRLDGV